MFLLICSIIVIVCAVKYIFRNKALYEFADKIPGPRAYAVVGSSHKFIKKNEHGEIKSRDRESSFVDGVSQSSVFSDRFDIMRQTLEKYQHNSLIRFWLGPALFIFVNDPKLIEQVLNSSKCLEKSFLYKFLRLDKGLLAAKRELIDRIGTLLMLLKDFFTSSGTMESSSQDSRLFLPAEYCRGLYESFHR